MTDSFANLRFQLNLLSENFDRLSASLAENARNVREEMVPPDEMLAEKISSARAEFVQFRESVIESAKATISPSLQVNGQANSLRGLQELIEKIESHCNEVKDLRQRATQVLDDVLSLRYRGQGYLPELRDCQQRALSVRDHLTASFSVDILPELRAVADRETAFAELLELISSSSTMDSERATALSIRLEESFGRRLVVEALRGQIYLPEKPEPPAPTSPAPTAGPSVSTATPSSASPAPATEPAPVASIEEIPAVMAEASMAATEITPGMEAEAAAEIEAKAAPIAETVIEPVIAETVIEPVLEPVLEEASVQQPTQVINLEEISSAIHEQAPTQVINLTELEVETPAPVVEPVLEFSLQEEIEPPVTRTEELPPLESLLSPEPAAATILEEPAREDPITENLVLPPGLTESLAEHSPPEPDVAATTLLDPANLKNGFDSLPSSRSPQSYDTILDESSFTGFETMLDKPAVTGFETTLTPPTETRAYDTVINEPDFYPSNRDSARNNPPSEIASELASELASLASTLAADLMEDSPTPYEITMLEQQTFPELSAYETRLDIIDADLIEEPAERVRVTEDLSKEELPVGSRTAQEIALSVLKPEVTPDADAFAALLWQMVIEDRLGLAYHLSKCLEQSSPAIPNRLPSHFIRGLALSQAVRYDAGEIAYALQTDFARYDEGFFQSLEADADSSWSYAIQLLIVSMVLRPALLAPSTQAESVISQIQLNTGLENLAGYCRTIFDFAIYKQPFDYVSLGPNRTPEQLQVDIEELNQQVTEWFSRASRFDLEDGMARKIWINWLMNQGKISSLLQPILQNDTKRLAIVKSEIEALSNDLEIEAEVNKTNREIRGWDAPEINPRAMELICRSAREAISFAQRWVGLQQSHLRQQREDPINRNRDLRETLLEMRDRVFDDIERFRRTQTNLYLRCAAHLCLRAVNDIDRMLSGAEEPGPESSMREILNADLLRLPEIPLNRRWEPEGVSDERLTRGILETVADNRFDWRQAFDMRKKQEDHEATQRIIELLSLNRNNSVRLDELSAEREQHLAECRLTLQTSVAMLRERIEAGVVTQWLNAPQRAEYITRIEEIEREIPTALRFFELTERLKDLNLSLESYCHRMRVESEARRNREVEALRNKVETVRFNLREADYRRILETLEDGDLETSEDYLRRALAGDQLPIRYDEAFHLREFFPYTLRNIITLSNSILAGGSLVDDAKNLLGEPLFAEQEKRAIQAWETCKRAGHIAEEPMREILDFLGFRLLGAEQYRTRIPGDLVLTLALKDERMQVAIPQYTSGAVQKYRVICLFDDQSPEEMATFIGNTTDQSATIVLYFGSLLEEQRRTLARLCRESRLSFLVLDDLLLLHLCKQRYPRTEALFHCALPFSFSNPYSPEQPAPPEIFFGRAAELQHVLEMNGASFVYGGRRFGKTSILLEAKRQFEQRSVRGEHDHLAIYIDFNAEGIAVTRPLDYLWKRLSDVLYEIVGTGDSLRQNLGANLTFSQIRKWLDISPNHKLLLLLDDADAFIQQDGAEGFIRCNRFKSLIEDPSYQNRFKVVFAGGNQLLRATQVENQPLLHANAAVEVGALLNDKSDIQAAIQLIERVFTSIGYEFEKPELILQILSFTEYFPHLIHLYCQHLLRSLSGLSVPAFDTQVSPPYMITADHVRDAVMSPELNQRMRECFLWTMELDRRYLTIAQLMAYYSGPESTQGLTDSWIRYKTLMWWPEGFGGDESLFAIRDLLDEMKRLRLLRQTGDRYFLGSPHLRTMLGTQEELEIALSNSDKQPLPQRADAALMRHPYGSQVSRRSPITSRQFHQLRKRENGVSIIFGCRATDLDSADLFLAHSLPQEFICMNKYASRSDFVRTLNELQQRLQGAVQILYIPADCSWNEEWMAEAVRYTEKLTDNERYARVVFASDSVKTWRWLNLEDTRKAELNLANVSPLFALTAWADNALRMWLDEIGILADEAERAQITEVTGNWPILLDKFYRLASVDPRNWQHVLVTLRDSFRDYREELELSMGLHLTDPSTILRELAKWGRASIDDLSAATATREEVVERAIKWGDLLGLVRPAISKESEKVKWQLAPLVHRLLTL